MGSIVVILVVLYVVFQLKKNGVNIISKDTANLNTFNRQQVRRRTKEIDKAMVTLMEDRRHDWLAKQLKEERELQYKLYDMFQIRIKDKGMLEDSASQLRLEHSSDCDAHNVRVEHSQNCDADMVRQSSSKMTQDEMDALKARIKERNR